MAKKLIRLTESDLHNIIKESVNSILKEDYNRLGIWDLLNELIANSEDGVTLGKVKKKNI